MRAFLGYVVDQRLKGNESRIKGYTIAVEALGRASSFDPAADPIIRVEAARLRRLISDYYAGPGANDPVLIDVPKGGYVPVFQYREAASAPADAPAPQNSGRKRVALAALAASALLAASLAVFLLLPQFNQPGGEPPGPDEVLTRSDGGTGGNATVTAGGVSDAAAPADSQTAGAPGAPAHPPLFKGDLPRIYVADIAVDGALPQPAVFSPAKVHDNLAAALRLFSEVELSETANEADYRVEGRASFTGDNVFLSFILVYAPSTKSSGRLCSI
ncbi:hypothetical protein [Breoghania sp. L-A4]|uniref:hypothetical protein n=1 Tax=Breoghania sp. L-A4 TaxID=2304600 RepID=UPI000E3592D8|nr:hypothetical protein [Breoghania sp. L-A4]AXS39434.1 hypothetical protein D1F64_04465 [Breoghania sp. L-A4]